MTTATATDITKIDPTEVQSMGISIQELLNEINAITIDLEGNADEACSTLEAKQILCVSFTKSVNSMFDAAIKARYAAWKELTAMRKELTDLSKEATDISSKKIGAYRAEMARIQREADEAARAIALQAQEDSQLDIAAHLSETQGETAADTFLESVTSHPVPLPKISTPSMQPNVSKGSQLRVTWAFEITDKNLLPKNLLIADEKAIGALVRSQKGNFDMPGVKVWPVEKHHVR